MPSPDPDQLKSDLANSLPSVPQEEVSHLVDTAAQLDNGRMTSEELLNLLVADPRIAQLLSRLQQTQSGGVSLGANNTIGQMADAVAGNKIDASGSQGTIANVTGSVTQVYLSDPKTLVEILRGGGGAPAPPASPRDVAIERYVRQFSKAIESLMPQGPKYDFPLTFQLISETGEPIDASAGTPIDQLISCVQNAGSRKVILRGAAGSGKTTAMQQTTVLIHKRGYDTIIPIYIELRRLKPDALQWVSENLDEEATAEGYLEPLLHAANTQPNMDTLKCLGDYAESKADGMLLVMVDGLNEIYGEEAASSILHRLDAYIQERPGAYVIVSDRIIPRDAITANWQIAQIERIPLEVVADRFKAKQDDARYNQLTDNDRSLLQTAYFLNYALEHNTPVRLSSTAEAIAAFFEELAQDLKFTDDALDRMAAAAFDAYKQHRSPKFDVDTFATAVGQENFDKLEYAGVVIQLSDEAASQPGAPQAQFDHPLKHDYLAARYLSRADVDWTLDALDVVSFESNSFDALAMTLELLPDEARCDKFIQRVHNWNWAAALVCIAKAMRTGGGRHSLQIQLAVLALVAEKMFDPVQQTRKRANEVLALFPPEIAAPYKDIRSLPELYALVQQQAQSEAKFQDRDPWFPKWRDLFVRFDSPTFGESYLKQIISNQAIIGWTVANVFRRFKLSDLDVRQLRAYYDACAACDYGDWRASTIRSRVVHALGSTDTAVAVDLLFEALSQDRYLWARIGAARSLIEIAALTADAELRRRVIDALISRVADAESETLALKMLREIGHSAFYSDAHEGWGQAVTPLISLVRDLQQSAPEREWWSNLLAEFGAYCQGLVALSVGAADGAR